MKQTCHRYFIGKYAIPSFFLMVVIVFGVLSCSKDKAALSPTPAPPSPHITTTIVLKDAITKEPLKNIQVILENDLPNSTNFMLTTNNSGSFSYAEGGRGGEYRNYFLSLNDSHRETSVYFHYPKMHLQNDLLFDAGTLFDYYPTFYSDTSRLFEIEIYRPVAVALHLQQLKEYNPVQSKGNLYIRFLPRDYEDTSLGRSFESKDALNSTVYMRLEKGRMLDTTVNITLLSGLFSSIRWEIAEDYSGYNVPGNIDLNHYDFTWGPWPFEVRSEGTIPSRQYTVGFSEILKFTF